MQTVIIVIHLLIVLTMIGLVLLQRSEGGGLGMGGGGFMSTRGTANLLSRSTAYLAAGFFATSLILSILAGYDRKPTSILNTGAPAGPTVPAPTTAPLGSGSGGVLDQLQRPAQPTPPAGPQVPQSQ
ncbi:preprotein translocase subunit SecG [Pseudorhodoplanes sp.]|uniref:preprotein translocase subunit SecG n=1 Tax=Pseudorhodoplanes sp. TaxID=1934341 RepID=UPI002CD9E87F|nr:preprotein translocase subunit SecG [Pseudorhodoplanes sp.]HWV53605.1 preprotein translocase subunit SecG [Pseudorhodoplanes sp.]